MVARSNEVEDDVIDWDVSDAVAEANEDDSAPQFSEAQMAEMAEIAEAEAKRRRGGRPRKTPFLRVGEVNETQEHYEARLKRIRAAGAERNALKALTNAEIKAERAAAGLPLLPSCPSCRKVTKLDGTPCRRCFPTGA
jgi:hypothetical protein